MYTTTCIKCHEENAYYNGVNYECPNCDLEWDKNQSTYIESEEEDTGYDDNELKDFKTLLNLEKPFFKLQKGEIYGCTVGYLNASFDYIQEPEQIIPLAFKENRNTLFVLFYNKFVLKKYPNYLKDLTAMSFNAIENGSYEDYFGKDTPHLVLLKMATTDKGEIIDLDACLSDFKLLENK